MRKQTNAVVKLSSTAQHTLFNDVHQRQDIEACGVLLGSIDDKGNWHVKTAFPLRNIAQSPVYFEFAPEDLLAVERDHPDQIVGVYHSHPTGLSTASSTDRRNMQHINIQEQIPWIWIIISGPFHLIAYHHYKHLGLQQVTIKFESARVQGTLSPESPLPSLRPEESPDLAGVQGTPSPDGGAGVPPEPPPPPSSLRPEDT